MKELAAIRSLSKRDAYHQLVLAPLETMTRSLRRGDPWDATDLIDTGRRCRALADAIDMRVEAEKQRNE